MNDLVADLAARWRPSDHQVALCTNATDDRPMYTAHLLVGKTFGCWTNDVQVVHLDGLFFTRDAVCLYTQAAARFHHEHKGGRVVGGYTRHFGDKEWAVWEDVCSEF